MDHTKTGGVPKPAHGSKAAKAALVHHIHPFNSLTQICFIKHRLCVKLCARPLGKRDENEIM